jgi:hypothetical protein
LNVMKDLLESFSYPGKKAALVRPDRETVVIWTPDIACEGVLAQ